MTNENTATSDELLTPQEWAALDGLTILDPDGWRGKDDPPFDAPTTREDYKRRVGACTVGPLGFWYQFEAWARYINSKAASPRVGVLGGEGHR